MQQTWMPSFMATISPRQTGSYVWVYLLQMLCILDVISARDRSLRYEDLPFNKTMVILDQTVTCGTHKPGQFVAPTYTCADIKVNGRRLAYGFYQGWGVGEVRCQDTHGIHEFAQLCRLMLAFHGKQSLGFHAVYIPNSTCGHINEPRKLLKKISETTFMWTDLDPGRGWTSTLQCMTDLA